MKPIEEAAKAFNQFNIETFKAGVKFAQRWIPVEEELPEVGECILIISKSDAFRKYTTFDVDNVELQERIKEIATHWRPIELK